jgi:hypothetical protein
MDVLLICENNKKNIEIINILENYFNLTIGFWLQEKLIDYEYNDNVFIFETKPDDPKFIEKLYYFRNMNDFKPDAIVFIGTVIESWAVSSLKSKNIIEVPIILLSTDFNVPLTDFEYTILEKFNYISIISENDECYDFLEFLYRNKNNFTELDDILKKTTSIEEFSEVCVKKCNSRQEQIKLFEKILKVIQKDLMNTKTINGYDF